jgi:hypothetical protein
MEVAVAGEGFGEIRYDVFWQALLAFPKRNPFATNLIVATVKTSVADLLVQIAERKEDGIDWKRNALFTVFGFGYCGAFQWLIYVSIFSRICPNARKFASMSWAEKLKFRAGQIDVVKQTIYDNFLHFTFIYFPAFYTFKECIQGGSGQSPWAMFTTALKKYRENIWQDNLAMWALWIPADLVVFFVAPLWLRMPMIHSVSLAWIMTLSSMRGA